MRFLGLNGGRPDSPELGKLIVFGISRARRFMRRAPYSYLLIQSGHELSFSRTPR